MKGYILLFLALVTICQAKLYLNPAIYWTPKYEIEEIPRNVEVRKVTSLFKNEKGKILVIFRSILGLLKLRF